MKTKKLNDLSPGTIEQIDILVMKTQLTTLKSIRDMGGDINLAIEALEHTLEENIALQNNKDIDYDKDDRFTPCCNRYQEPNDKGFIWWNGYNKRVQCHACGVVYKLANAAQ